MSKQVAINLFHILAVVPFFIYVGITREKLDTSIFSVLFWLGILLIFYHGYKFYDRMVKGSSYAWVNAIHALALGPLLVYIGSMGSDTARGFFEGLLLFAFSALGYHTYELAMYRDFYI